MVNLNLEWKESRLEAYAHRLISTTVYHNYQYLFSCTVRLVIVRHKLIT